MNPPLQNGLRATASAFTALAGKRPQLAAELWLQAAESITQAAPSEPLRAAAHNNAGVAYLLREEPRDAAEQFALAQRLWDRSRAHVERSDIPIASRSSVFHLQLAMQHHDRFETLRRQRHLTTCAAAHAITHFNVQHAGVTGEDRHAVDADQPMIDVLSSAFGPDCAEIRLLRQGARMRDVLPPDKALEAYRNKADLLAKRQPRSYVVAEPFCDDLDRAAQMTALLHRGLLPPRPTGEARER